MKALWKSESGLLKKVEIEEPVIKEPDDVKVKVLYATIGAEDLRMYREGDVYSRANIAGYEMSGIVTGVGQQAAREGFEVGQRVAGTPIVFCGKCDFCRRKKEYCCSDFQVRAGTICEYLVWKSRQLVPLNSQISDKIGALVEPVAVVVEAAERLRITMGDSVCIFGGDFQGLALLQLVRMYGAQKVTVVESVERRRELALQLGADHVVDPGKDGFENELLKITAFEGFDAVAITSGDIGIFNKSMDLVSWGGEVLLMTYYELGQKLSVESINMYYSHITITSSALYTRDKLDLTVSLLPKLQMAKLISAEFPFEQAIEAYEAVKTGLYPKVAIKM